MHTQEQKEYFWKQHRKVLLNRTIYTVLGWLFYPFIQRTNVRKKVYEGRASNYTLFLWFMLNDDELNKPQNLHYDFDLLKVKKDKPKYNLDSKWGRFKASYWFNALRNPAYNYLLSHPPYEQVNIYSLPEITIDNIYRGETKVSPLSRAEWEKVNGRIDIKKSKVGEGEIWYHPNEDTTVSLCRYSKAYMKTFWKWNFYITYQKGEFQGGGKYDSKIKVHTERKS